MTLTDFVPVEKGLIDAGTTVGGSRVRALLRTAPSHQVAIAVPAGVIAQAWRDGPRQARVARLLAASAVSAPPLDELTADGSDVDRGPTANSAHRLLHQLADPFLHR